jgi:hypothetical protein
MLERLVVCFGRRLPEPATDATGTDRYTVEWMNECIQLANTQLDMYYKDVL